MGIKQINVCTNCGKQVPVHCDGVLYSGWARDVCKGEDMPIRKKGDAYELTVQVGHGHTVEFDVWPVRPDPVVPVVVHGREAEARAEIVRDIIRAKKQLGITGRAREHSFFKDIWPHIFKHLQQTGFKLPG